jgi:hypothetical protein
METTPANQLSNRDRAVLRAIDAGRATLSGLGETALFIDGLRFTDQFVGRRLSEAGLIADLGPGAVQARLTPNGLAALQAA